MPYVEETWLTSPAEKVIRIQESIGEGQGTILVLPPKHPANYFTP
jgi:hypothetical protein